MGYNIDMILMEAGKMMKCPPEDIVWFSWPECFPSTGGPRGGCGGQTMTTFQVFAFQWQDMAMKCCAGVWRHWDGNMGSPWRGRKLEEREHGEG